MRAAGEDVGGRGVFRVPAGEAERGGVRGGAGGVAGGGGAFGDRGEGGGETGGGGERDDAGQARGGAIGCAAGWVGQIWVDAGRWPPFLSVETW